METKVEVINLDYCREFNKAMYKSNEYYLKSSNKFPERYKGIILIGNANPYEELKSTIRQYYDETLELINESSKEINRLKKINSALTIENKRLSESASTEELTPDFSVLLNKLLLQTDANDWLEQVEGILDDLIFTACAHSDLDFSNSLFYIRELQKLFKELVSLGR